MRRNGILFVAIIALILGAALYLQYTEPEWPPEELPAASGEVEDLYDRGVSGVFVEFYATVDRLLADDNEGSRHQRFIVELKSGHTVLVSHNIDLAVRVPIREGTEIAIRGEYEWNDRGGVVHWTHHDPRGRIEGGWIDVAGKRFR